MSVAPITGVDETLGADRVIAPLGALPQPADRLDAAAPARPREFEIEVERLCLDATSFAQIRSSCGADPAAMADRIAEIVAARGKLHNPETDSGGVAVGTVTAIGSGLDPQRAPAPGERIVTLASLTLTPLRLEGIAAIDPKSAQIEVRGRAYVAESAPWAPVPGDLPLSAALAALDVYGAASHTRALAAGAASISVLGCGHAGLLALAAARESAPGARLVAIDRDRGRLDLATSLGVCDVAVEADLRDPLAALRAASSAGVEPADLAVFVVSAAGCEPAAVLLTSASGTLLFFSMATSFQTAALTADGMGSGVRMLIGSGWAADLGSYALELLRSDPRLCAALGSEGTAR